ncbi:RsmB/NOP family class I SAM-dependent RNA methyltransferase [Neisseria sp. Ec49-e6-T10]|uniref:RsmB/NOP family class I SAM-dependent RNA methyltransferase n=1 Tax=Neisseria sp. Ec49-e6-T10 TaxID=3140744 RepID=UPI003EBDBBE5
MTPIQLQHTEHIVTELLAFTQPADSILASYFKKNSKIGAKDRYEISEVVFALLRRYETLMAFFKQKTQAKNLILGTLVLNKQKTPAELAIFANDKEQQQLQQLCQQAPTISQLNLNTQTELPNWLLDKLSFFSPQELHAFASSLTTSGPLDLRVNTLKAKRDNILKALQQEGIDAISTPFSPWGIRLTQKKALNKHPLFTNGTIEIQDEGSQLLALLTQAKRGEMMIDFCAGAGGKTLALGAMMANTGRIYAIDVSDTRLRNIKPRLERSGLTNVTIQHIAQEQDSRLHKLYGKADKVLIDAPCSGLGTLRRHPDLKYRQNDENLAKITQMQQNILCAAAPLVKKGGKLIYATCSILPEENEQQIALFLANHPDFSLCPVQDILKQQKIALDMEQYLNLTPHQHQTDGFFAAILVKN